MRTTTVSGKIILTGEYAVLFGYEGIAVPSPLKMTVAFEEDAETKDLSVAWEQMIGKPEWQKYLKAIIHECGKFGGSLTIASEIPLGKGMGSSTSLVIAVCKSLLGEDCKERAEEIEDIVNPGNSGIDFAVIWSEKPVRFIKGSKPEVIELPVDILKGALLIDTGEPDQQTPELIAWIKERKIDLSAPLKTIGDCTERLRKGEDLATVIRDHNKAQQSLGVVSDKAKELITKIEQEGGAAKVIGAGSKTGGCGMILVIGIDAKQIDSMYPIIQL